MNTRNSRVNQKRMQTLANLVNENKGKEKDTFG